MVLGCLLISCHKDVIYHLTIKFKREEEPKKELKIFREYIDIKNKIQKLSFKRKHVKKSILLAAILIINIYFTFLLSPPVFANKELKIYETNCCTIQYFNEEQKTLDRLKPNHL